jgi:hypothetical protein
VNASAWQKGAILVPVLKSGFFRHGGCALQLLSLAILVLLSDHKSVLKVLHDQQEFRKRKFLLAWVDRLKEIFGLGGVSAEALENRLEVLGVNLARLFLIKHIEDAFEILYLLS